MTTPFEALAGLQVLILEDEGLIAEELRERITHFGAIVADVVDTAEQAVAAAERATPDVVLMDVRLLSTVIQNSPAVVIENSPPRRVGLESLSHG